MAGPSTPEGAEELARLVSEIHAQLPEDMFLVAFLIGDVGGFYQSVVLSTGAPDRFAPVLRRWLERYDAGEADGIRLDG